MKRLPSFMLMLLISIDQFLQTLFVGLWWTLTGKGHLPNPDETVSGFLGRHEGRWWAVLPTVLIDAMFLILTLGRERNHCAVTARREGA